jgi:hypothetical protein
MNEELKGKSFIEKWKIGMKRLSAEQMLDAQLVSHFGQLVGAMFVTIVFFWFVDYKQIFTKGSLSGFGFAIFMLFIAVMKYFDVVNTYKAKARLLEEQTNTIYFEKKEINEKVN